MLYKGRLYEIISNQILNHLTSDDKIEIKKEIKQLYHSYYSQFLDEALSIYAWHSTLIKQLYVPPTR